MEIKGVFFSVSVSYKCIFGSRNERGKPDGSLLNVLTHVMFVFYVYGFKKVTNQII